jgi:hypothetical protein
MDCADLTQNGTNTVSRGKEMSDETRDELGCCAHLHIEYKRSGPNEYTVTAEWWECRDCKTRFIPEGKYPAMLAERDGLRKELSIERQWHAATKHSVIATIGGVDYEGNPTSTINYLQRLRILIEAEKERDALRERVTEAKRSAKFWEDTLFKREEVMQTRARELEDELERVKSRG